MRAWFAAALCALQLTCARAACAQDYHPDAAKKSPLTKGLFIHAMVLVVLWSIFFVLARYVGQHQELAAFDPYAVRTGRLRGRGGRSASQSWRRRC